MQHSLVKCIQKLFIIMKVIFGLKVSVFFHRLQPRSEPHHPQLREGLLFPRTFWGVTNFFYSRGLIQFLNFVLGQSKRGIDWRTLVTSQDITAFQRIYSNLNEPDALQVKSFPPTRSAPAPFPRFKFLNFMIGPY